MSGVDPVIEHLRTGGRENGYEIVRLAARIGLPLTFDLLRFPPVAARLEAAHRIAKAVLSKK